ncbi:MAG TPA: YitT family protein, partial [Pseudogracilibacillus sp.]|nr:YitT family protein [Pseudogracilibacillus sp.]
NMREGVYTLLLVYIGARVIDFIQEGAYSARGLIIISKKHREIADLINTEMERGVTVLKGKGHYTKEEQEVLYCIVGKNEIVKAKNVILQVDPHAFVSVMTVHEVMGEGFTLDDRKEPIHPEQ